VESNIPNIHCLFLNPLFTGHVIRRSLVAANALSMVAYGKRHSHRSSIDDVMLEGGGDSDWCMCDVWVGHAGKWLVCALSVGMTLLYGVPI